MKIIWSLLVLITGTVNTTLVSGQQSELTEKLHDFN